MIYPTVSTSFFAHLNSLSHSSLPAEPSKNSTEGWNEFFHFSGESFSKRQGGRSGALGSCRSCTAQACPGISVLAAAPAAPPRPGPLQPEIKEKNFKHANVRNQHRGGTQTDFITGFLLSFSDCK